MNFYTPENSIDSTRSQPFNRSPKLCLSFDCATFTYTMKSPSAKLFPAMLDTSPKGLGWPSVSGFNRIRRKFGSRLRSGQSPASNLAKLQTSFDPNDTIRSLRAHTWSIYDGQYLILMILGIFCLSVIEEPGALAKTSIATLLMLSLLLPITRQFFLPFLPIAIYLVMFYSCRYVIICCSPPPLLPPPTHPLSRGNGGTEFGRQTDYQA